MFGFKIVTKREIALWISQIEDYKNRLLAMQKERDHERLRAEGAVNALLAKTQGLVLTPDDKSHTDDVEEARNMMFTIFGEDEEEASRQKDILEKLQS